MIQDLKTCMKNKSFCQVTLVDGDLLQGFIVAVYEDRFHIVTMEEVTANDPEDEEEDDRDPDFEDYFWASTVTAQRGKKEIDLMPVKQSHNPDLVISVVFDITHTVRPGLLKSLFWIRDNQLYKEAPVKRRQNPLLKRSTKKPTTRLRK